MEAKKKSIPNVCTLFFRSRSRNSFCWHKDKRNCNETSHCWQRKRPVLSAAVRLELLQRMSLSKAESFTYKSLMSACTASEATSINISTWNKKKLWYNYYKNTQCLVTDWSEPIMWTEETALHRLQNTCPTTMHH